MIRLEEEETKHRLRQYPTLIQSQQWREQDQIQAKAELEPVLGCHDRFIEVSNVQTVQERLFRRVEFHRRKNHRNAVRQH